jgi:hypothetical protein
MLLKRRVLDGIVDGSVSLVFRRWRKPTVKQGGTVKTAVGVIAIGDVATIDASKITARDAKRAGYHTLDTLKSELSSRDGGETYRIEVLHAGDDPRIALRAKSRKTAAERADLLTRLQRLDRDKPWTRHTLGLIAAHPGVRAADLAAMTGQQTISFKVNVRKLKSLGLTESLEVSYRLSPRGRALLAQLAG